MRKLLFILFLLISTLAGATTYYIDPAGTDGAGVTGDITHPWLTLAYAATRVTTAGDIIHINAGSYTETAQSSISVGVNIEGVGATSIIVSHVSSVNTGTILLYSASQGTDGNQTLSNFKMDGDALTGNTAISVVNRKNVIIHDLTLDDFYGAGIRIVTSPAGVPTTYLTGNKIYNCTITNCTRKTDGTNWYTGNIEISGQDGLLIYDNTIIQEVRTSTTNGDCIRGVNGYFKNMKIYGNTITCTAFNYTSYNFAMELWYGTGGNEIYNNTIQGSSDIVHFVKGASTYSLLMYGDTIGWATQVSNDELGLDLEGYTSDIIIRDNYFKNIAYPIRTAQGFTNPETAQNWYIYYNVFENTGYSTGNGGYSIQFTRVRTDPITWDNINIWNNVFYNDATYTPNSAVFLPSDGVATNISLRNNIVTGTGAGVFRASKTFAGSSINIMSIENNCYYDNATNDVVYVNITPTNVTKQNNLTVNPEFTTPGSDYSLQATSDCIDAGLGVGLTTDYAGNIVGDDPDIGAYEYGGVPPTPPPTLPEITTVYTYRWNEGAKVGGSEIDDGGGTVSAKGVCYSTSANPTTSSSKVEAGTGTASFFVRLTGLNRNTTYHIRAYVTNEEGTTYGSDMSFTTSLISYNRSGGKKVVSNGKYVN
jgi:hypothetical protein